MARRSLFVAALQTAGAPNDPEATFVQLEQRVRSLAALFDRAQLVLAPELHLMALPGLLDEHEGAMEERAVAIPGPLTERLGALARETGLWLVPGSVYERTAEGIYNTALVLSPKGRLLRHRRRGEVRPRHLPRRRLPRGLPADDERRETQLPPMSVPRPRQRDGIVPNPLLQRLPGGVSAHPRPTRHEQHVDDGHALGQARFHPARAGAVLPAARVSGRGRHDEAHPYDPPRSARHEGYRPGRSALDAMGPDRYRLAVARRQYDVYRRNSTRCVS